MRPLRSTLGRLLLLAFIGAASASSAEAHLVTTGLGPLYDGIGHFWLSPDDWATAAGVALLAGLSGAPTVRTVLLAGPLAWLGGGCLGLVAREPLPAAAPALALLAIGVLIASDRRLLPQVLLGVVVAASLLHGYLNGEALFSVSGAVLALLGVTAAVFVWIALLAAVVVSIRAPWQRVVIRVIGSWLAAIGLLLLGWTLRKG